MGIATYNVRAHVPSDIPNHNQIITSENLESQKHLEKINVWTENQKMKLNEKKTKNIIFNFSKKYQFITKLELNESTINLVKETKLLGTTITDDLKWNINTAILVKKGYQRMQLLNSAASFTTSRQDLKSIYVTFVRSILEQSAVVWHSSLSHENRKDLERVQKAAVRVVNKYTDYTNGLKILNLDSLVKRRTLLCLRFAKNCFLNEKVKNLFTRNISKHKMKKRKRNIFKVPQANTERYKKSAIPYMTKLLNNEYDKANLL